jgi:hypothetical protein
MKMKSRYGWYLVKILLLVVAGCLVALNPNPVVKPSRSLADDSTSPTLDEIRTNVFMVSCATTSCHSSERGTGGLILDGYNAYANLVDVSAENEAARAVGKKRVVPGQPDNSFLYQKLMGHLGPDEGDRMPQTGVPLPSDQIEMVRQWILKGALPSSVKDIQLPVPDPGAQVIFPHFDVPAGTEVQGNYYLTLPNTEEMRVTRFEILYPPGSHHLNFYAYQGDNAINPPKPEGTIEWTFNPVSFDDYALRAGSQRTHLIWDLPPGVAFKFDPHQKIDAQIHFVNTGLQTSPIGGTGVVNLYAAPDPSMASMPMGTMFGQNINVALPPHSTTIWDYGITFDRFGINQEVTIAAANGHFHWRGKTFEIRLWDGQNRNPDGTPVGCRPCTPEQTSGEFDRMGVQNRIYLSDNWNDPPFTTYGSGKVKIPPGWGIIYRAVFVNNTNQAIQFGPRVENQEHCNIFVYFYPGPDDGNTLAFPIRSGGG